MEHKIRNQTNTGNYKLIRVVSLVLLPILLVLHTFYFHEFSGYLLQQHNKLPVFPLWLWDACVKFVVYTVQILINFSILFAFTKRIHYALSMMYIAYGILFAGMLFVVLKEVLHLPIPDALIGFFVKINKALLLLVLFIAGYIVQRANQSKP